MSQPILMSELQNVQDNFEKNKPSLRLSHLLRHNKAFELLTPKDDPTEVRRFIHAVFAVHHLANYELAVNVWTDHFAMIRSKEGEILSAAGFRFAVNHQTESPLMTHQAFASDRYLSRPIESFLPTSSNGLGYERKQIVEIAHLASVGDAAGQQIMLQLALYLVKSGISWIVATITAPLQGLLERYGLAPIVIAPASITAIPHEERPLWGNYYEQDPRVVLISLKALPSCLMENHQ